MANVISTTKTNAFKVTDEDRYQILYNSLLSESEIYDLSEIINGEMFHQFGAYDSIGFINPEDDDKYPDTTDIDLFFDELQKILHKDTPFVYMDVGNEKLRDVYGYICVVTPNDKQYANLCDMASELASKMCGKDIKKSELFD